MEDDVFTIDNLEIHKKDNFVIISVNPKMYSLEVIYSAAYTFIDRAYILIEGNPSEEVLIQIRPKTSNINPEILGREFNNELLNYMVYMQRTLKSQSIREAIMLRVLNINPQVKPSSSVPNTGSEVYIEDPEKIAKPWRPQD